MGFDINRTKSNNILGLSPEAWKFLEQLSGPYKPQGSQAAAAPGPSPASAASYDPGWLDKIMSPPQGTDIGMGGTPGINPRGQADLKSALQKPAIPTLPPEANGGTGPVSPLPKPPTPKAPSIAQGIPKYRPDADLDQRQSELYRQRSAVPPDVAAARTNLQAEYGNRPKMPKRPELRAPGWAELLAAVVGVLFDPEHAGEIIAIPWQNRIQQNEQAYRDSMAVFQDETRAHEERIAAQNSFHKMAVDDWHAHRQDLQAELAQINTERRERSSRRKTLGDHALAAFRSGNYSEADRLLTVMEQDLGLEREAANEWRLGTRNNQVQNALANQRKGIQRDTQRAEQEMLRAMRGGDPDMVEHFGRQAGLSPKGIRPYLESAQARYDERHPPKPQPGFSPALFNAGKEMGRLSIVPEGTLNGAIGRPEFQAGRSVGAAMSKLDQVKARELAIRAMRAAAARGDVYGLEAMLAESPGTVGSEGRANLLRQAKVNAVRYMPESKRRLARVQAIDRELAGLRKQLAQYGKDWVALAGKGYPAPDPYGRKNIDENNISDFELKGLQAKERYRGMASQIAVLEAERKKLLGKGV